MQNQISIYELSERIYFIRGHRVMLDLETKVLNQAVRRNLEQFPPDFMFEVSAEEYETLNEKS